MSDAILLDAVRAATGFGLTWLAQSSALLLLGLAAGRWARSRGPALQSAVYRATLAAVLLGPAVSITFSAMGFEGLALRWPTAEAARPLPFSSSSPFIPAPPSSEPPYTDVRFTIAPLPTEPFTPLPASLPASPVVVERSLPRDAIAAVGLAGWGVGTLFLLARMLVRQGRMRRLRDSAADVEPETQALCEAIARELGVRTPPVRRSPFLSSPCLDGLTRPMILLPEGADDPRDAFVHELAHLARRDGWWNLTRRLAEAALWGQPLLWALSRRIESTAEEVCDDVVVSFGADRTSYAERLVELAGRALPPPSPTVVCMISLRSLLARRVARILDPSRTLSTRVGRRAVLAVAIVGLASTAFAGLLRFGDPPRAVTEEPAAAKADVPQGDRLRGRVVDRSGKPVARASVLAWSTRQGATGGPVDEQRRATTDAEGRYELDAFGGPPFDPKARTPIVALAEGFGPGAAGADGMVKLGEPGPPIDGRVVDSEGHPVPGAKIRLRDVFFLRSGKTADPAQPWSTSDRWSTNGLLPSPHEVETDADGRFRFTGLGRDSLAILAISGPDAALRHALVLTRAMDRTRLPNLYQFQDLRFGILDFTEIQGAACTIAVDPSRAVEGIVRDAADGSPISGAFVTATADWDWPRPVGDRDGAWTDAEGRYRLLGLPTTGDEQRVLFVYPAADQPYFVSTHLQVPAAPVDGPTRLDVALKRGVWIEGQVVDQADGQPVAARLDYVPAADNPRATDCLAANPGAIGYGYRLHGDRFRTDAQGHFRVLGVPGRGVVLVKADDFRYRTRIGAETLERLADSDHLATYVRIPPGSFHSLKGVDAADGPSASAGAIAVVRGASVALKFVDEDGSPVPAQQLQNRVPTDLGGGFLPPRAEARILGLDPGETRVVIVQNFDRNLGVIVTVSGDTPPDTPARTVLLAPIVPLTGRLVHADGKPARGQISVQIDPGNQPFARPMDITWSELDSQGRFKCFTYRGAGCRLFAMNLTHEDGRGGKGFGWIKVPGGFQGFDLVRDLNVEAGEPVDLGTFDVDSGKRIEGVAATDVGAAR
ncbi:M56 family metallopeptidase [Planctomyces sp. SH-PL62]|uniref:M56 family metallopeptidase n=1 Tax=Planctomyces sp. SH-PL62 TaxID=1636152 RepID=UPI00078B297B|nr:M56 family metallopeptidase [Planctomyces sp. SH-PL62]AMV37673.1 Regulatory protein BlaR1 [Planctomyces sp. SH-PL62]